MYSCYSFLLLLLIRFFILYYCRETSKLSIYFLQGLEIEDGSRLDPNQFLETSRTSKLLKTKKMEDRDKILTFEILRKNLIFFWMDY